jgi:hypothetical protein
VSILQTFGIAHVHHYTPLHYLVFIARHRALLSKPALMAVGYLQTHFRSKSRSQDVDRGFGTYVHLTLDDSPPILAAKLAAGFPHVRVTVPVHSIEAIDYSLCRFNVAMTRRLRRCGKSGFGASATNGRYYPGHEIPIARSDADKTAMLTAHLRTGTMIEVLIPDRLPLPDETVIACYCEQDRSIAQTVLARLGNSWELVVEAPAGRYARNDGYVAAVLQFVERAMADRDWRGDGLEFDRL